MYSWATLSQVFAGLVLAGWLQFALAQEDICSNSVKYRWTYNSQGASPCVVAGTLLSVCLNDTTTIRKLDPGERYPGAQASGEGSACRCSTVYYSMLSACAYCQDQAWITWPVQIVNCVDTFSQALPITIPGGTNVVPPWAWADVVSQGAFDIAVAQTITTTPAPGPTSTSSSDTILSSSTSVLSTPLPSNTTPVGTTGTKSTPIGPIVGGVIGGLVVIGIVAVLIVWLVTRSRRNTAMAAGTAIGTMSPPIAPVAYNVTTPPVHPVGPGGTRMPKLYDPNDPTTFPMMMQMDQSPSAKASPAATSVAISTGTPPMNSVPPILSPPSSPPQPATQPQMKLVPNRAPVIP